MPKGTAAPAHRRQPQPCTPEGSPRTEGEEGGCAVLRSPACLSRASLAVF